MTCYIVTFETSSPDSQTAVEAGLKETYEDSRRIHESCWAVLTDESAISVREALWNLLEKPTRVFVVRSGTEAAWVSYGEETSEWLKKNL